jgi:arylsulfatase A-like enzyme
MKKKPNIILITIDCLRYDLLTKEINKNKSRLPFLKTLSKQGLLFKNFYANGSWSGTAMPAILASSYPFQNQGRCELFGRQPTLAQKLKKEGGYFTIGVNDNPYFFSKFGYHLGFDYFCDWNFSSNSKVHEIKNTFNDWLRQLPERNVFAKIIYLKFNQLLRPFIEKIYPPFGLPYLQTKKVNQIVIRALDYYRRKLRQKPLFLWAHYMDLHMPLTPQKKYLVKKINAKKIRQKASQQENLRLDQAEKDGLKELYLASLSQIDQGLRKLYRFIKKRLGSTNLTFIVTTDHGEILSEKKGFYGHGLWLYQELTHLPLLIFGTGIKPGQPARLGSQVDLAPTITQMAGVKPAANWQGASLLKPKKQKAVFIEEGRVKRRDHFLARGFGIKWPKRSFAVVGENFKYIKNFFWQEEELYDLAKDPSETKNLINQKNHQKLSHLKKRLAHHLKNYQDDKE